MNRICEVAIFLSVMLTLIEQIAIPELTSIGAFLVAQRMNLDKIRKIRLRQFIEENYTPKP